MDVSVAMIVYLPLLFSVLLYFESLYSTNQGLSDKTVMCHCGRNCEKKVYFWVYNLSACDVKSLFLAAGCVNMGCVESRATRGLGHRKYLRKPRPWKHTEYISRAQLKQMRDEFWDTAPYYGGQKEIWDALRAAAEAEINLAQLIVDSAGIIVHSEDLSTCYDERGAKYDLPTYVLSEPTNIKGD